MKNDQWLEKYRMKRGLTQEQVSVLVGIERSYYTKIENGLIPSVKVAKSIAKFYGFKWTKFFENNCVVNAQ